MEDVQNIQQESANSNVVNNLANSIGPFIQGRALEKKALLLMLMGGTEINMKNGSHLRGDINILLCGDPGCGKSQLLRAMMNLAPNCVNTTGKGSSGVGLTAAIISDPDTRQKHVEGGAMVLADRGLLCIDEFDKLNDVDRVAIHEAMEQQTVTLAKAGIHIVLNTRCSVLAASNPTKSTWDRKLPIRKNIALPDSLISRFDLLFVILDDRNMETDDLIAKKVLENHLVNNNFETAN